MNCVIPQITLELAQKLNQITPEHINRFFFSNSGAEATEACVKLARAATGRRNVVVFQGSFHGRTHLAMAMTTSKTIYRHNYQPLPSGIFVAPFPNSYYYGWSEADTVAFCLKQLELLFAGQTAPDETAAIIIEPILGEGGYVPAPKSFLRELRQICQKYGILLVMDEVQSGFGRSGKMFCFEHADILPDIMVMAKGLGSGLPISCIAAPAEIMEKWPPGTHGGTYGGGSTMAAAAACATIEVLLEEQLAENAAQRGRQLQSGLMDLQRSFPVIGDIRGKGLMVGTEFTDSAGNPDSIMAKRVLQSCLDRKLLMLLCGRFSNVIRWIPPLTVSEAEITAALDIFEDSLHEANVAHQKA
jgi:4-aminobutyrate aminotransferase